MKTMIYTIGQAAKQAKVNIQTLRYYERIGLLKPISRKSSGYRVYSSESVDRVSFIKRAQDLGFNLTEVRELLSLRASSSAAREKVRYKAQEKLISIKTKIRDLKKMESTLSKLIHDCERGLSTSKCPILEKMEGIE